MSPTSPVVPLPRSARDAIDGNSTLRQLLARRRQALDRFRVLAPLVPVELVERVTVGGLDAQRWTLLADGAASAAKLRQLLPRFEAVLRAKGLGEPPLVIRVRSR
jgi:hypothetical protein